MSKRYREAVEDVVTPADVDGGVQGGDGDGDREVVAARVDPDVGRGGVTTLVRSTGVRAAEVAPVGEAATERGTRPGNGPADADEPLAFTWRGRRYVVTRILGHWREEAGWWRRPDGEPIRIEQSDLWRVEAGPADGVAGEARGVYELSHRGGDEGSWRLDRVWD